MNRTKSLRGSCAHCGRALTFPAELIGTVGQCPHCGRQAELLLAAPEVAPMIPRRAIVWTLIAVLVLVGGLVASLFALKRAERLAAQHKPAGTAPARATIPSEVVRPTAEQGIQMEGFEVSAVQLEKSPTGPAAYAVGTVVNRLDRARTSVQLELDLLNAAGEKVGMAMDSTPGIEAGGRWQFRAPVIISGVAAARLSAVRELAAPAAR